MSEQLCDWRQLLLCNLELACLCAGFAALLWLTLEPVMEIDDEHETTPVGIVFGHGLGGQSLRGAGVGSHVP